MTDKKQPLDKKKKILYADGSNLNDLEPYEEVLCYLVFEPNDVKSSLSDFFKELDYWINHENGDGKYFMSLGIDKLNEKIKELKLKHFGEGFGDQSKKCVK